MISSYLERLLTADLGTYCTLPYVQSSLKAKINSQLTAPMAAVFDALEATEVTPTTCLSCLLAKASVVCVPSGVRLASTVEQNKRRVDRNSDRDIDGHA